MTRDQARPAPAHRSAQVSDELARLRAGVLGGRGPGAGPVEVEQHTRARTGVGGEPVSRLREQVSRQAAVARRDPDALAQDVAEDRARLAGTVRALRTQLAPASRRAGARALPWCLVAVQTVLLGVAAARARRRR